MAFGIVLAAFGCCDLGVGRLWRCKKLDIDIPTLVTLVFLLYMAFPCLCNDEIKYEHAHNRNNRGGGGDREHVK